MINASTSILVCSPRLCHLQAEMSDFHPCFCFLLYAMMNHGFRMDRTA